MAELNPNLPEYEEEDYEQYRMLSSYNDFAKLLQFMHETGLSEFDARCFFARKIIEEFMSDPEINTLIKEKQADYVHNRGWSKGKRYKEEVFCPLEAWLVLPESLRDDPKALRRWLKINARYMVFKGAL